jgi:hypothetical protein
VGGKNVEFVEVSVAIHHASERKTNRRLISGRGYPEAAPLKPFLKVSRRSQYASKDFRKTKLRKESGSRTLDFGKPRKVRIHGRTDRVTVSQMRYTAQRRGSHLRSR